MGNGAPLATVEVRWFFERADDRYETVRRWFLAPHPLPNSRPFDPSAWSERTDVYLLIPGADDMGVKWREGQLQIKGRVASLGAHVFSDQHTGVVERWAKWSYADLPAAYRGLFDASGDSDDRLLTLPVHKRRALYAMAWDEAAGTYVDSKPGAEPVRGLGVEFTELDVRGQAYGTLGFEAYPDDELTRTAFALDVAHILGTLEGAGLAANNSMSYPAWLGTLRW